MGIGMKNRLICLILLVLMAGMAVTACGCGKGTNENSSQVNGSSVTTEKPKDKSIAETAEKVGTEKGPLEESNKNKGDKSDSNIAAPKSTSSNVEPDKTTIANDSATLIVTKDFGRQTLNEKKTGLKADWTVIDLLESTSKITTKWDGSFVNGIGGIESQNGGFSRDGQDWFYYVNGICGDAGADGYKLKSGEVVWWDYHAWKNMGSANSAVIGCYPEPFIHGYRGKIGATAIMSSSDHLSLAGELQKAMLAKGVRSVNIIELNNNLLENRQVPTIVLGTWDKVGQLSWLEKFNNAYRKTGVSVHFTDKGLELLDYGGQTAQTINGSAGVIAAAGSGLGDSNPLWLIVGTDREGLKQAVDVLANRPESIVKFYNAAVTGGKIIRLPLP